MKVTRPAYGGHLTLHQQPDDDGDRLTDNNADEEDDQQLLGCAPPCTDGLAEALGVSVRTINRRETIVAPTVVGNYFLDNKRKDL